MPTSRTCPVSAIVIGRNEAAGLRLLIPRLKNMRGVGEVVFCDGGSHDGSREVASQAGAAVIEASGGRGAQLRAGAERAQGEVLWFLHADARPHRSSAAAIARAVRDPQVLGGSFRLRFGSASLWARAFEIIARVQRMAGIYYGDSGQWARREVYEALGGYRDWPLFEDYDFARRLEALARQRGAKTACLRPAIVASSRRFEREPRRVLMLWLAMQRRFARGEDPRDLAREYHRK